MTNSTEFIVSQRYHHFAQQATKHLGVLLYLLCLLGTLMNIFTFLQRAYKCRACSLYLLFASICDLAHLNAGALSNILQYGFGYDWTLRSSIYCPVKNYCVFVFTITSGTLTVLACVDRYMLSSEQNTRWNYRNRRVACHGIQITIAFWIVASLPVAFCSKRFSHPSHNEQMICVNPCDTRLCFLVRLIFTCLIDGFLPPVLMMLFGVLTSRNVSHLHRRSHSHRSSKINQQITTMLILQTVKSTFASFPLAGFNCYSLFTKNHPKALVHQAKENLIMQIVYLFFWSNYTSFFVYLCSSDIFRQQWLKAMKKVICCSDGNRRRRQTEQFELRRLKTTE